MKAIILSAGQGKRLSPHTDSVPKCLVDVAEDTTMLGWQLSQLAKAGVDEVTIVTGFCAEKVDLEVFLYRKTMKIRTLFNPFYKIMDNLGSIWHARKEMSKDFIILNGDTLFHADVVRRLLHTPIQDVTVCVSRKSQYDDDDMKVTLDNDLRLTAISKELDLSEVSAESIGMILFRNQGVQMFRDKVVEMVEDNMTEKKYYLSVIDALAKESDIHTMDVTQDEWCEVDFPVDLDQAKACVSNWRNFDQGAPLEAVKSSS